MDVKPFHVKAHLAYSMHHLGLDHIDLYQPARMDGSVPVEELIGVLSELVKEGYIGSIGLTELSPENLERAAKVHPIKTVELDYSLANRRIEQNGILDTARKNNIDVLVFGVLSHGLLSDAADRTHPAGDPSPRRPGLPPAFKEELLSGIRGIAQEMNTTVENLTQAYVYAKNRDMSILIGTTRKEHLQDSIDALSVDLSAEDIQRIESVFPAEKLQGMGMRNIVFKEGQIVRS